MQRRQTLARPVQRAGVGVHSGQPATLRMGPAPWGTGLCFRQGGEVIPAQIAYAVAEPGATVLCRGVRRIGTPEHLLAALYGSGISDAWLELDGPEVPILDGSALPWCQALHEAGIRVGPRWEPHRVMRRQRVRLGEGWAEAVPDPEPILRVEVAFDSPGAPRGVAQVRLDEASFLEDVAFARTFVLERDVPRLQAAGRGKGATAENTVVYGPTGPSVLTRSFDEGVRHKLLDLIGDLALLGAPLRGRVTVHKGSHALHQRLVQALVGGLSPPG